MDVREKIQKLDAILSEEKNMSLKDSRQEHILFPKFYLDKVHDLGKILLDKYGVSGKSKSICLAVMNLLEEIEKDEKV